LIITRAPYRVSFFGGSTDYPAWYLDHGGACLSATIDYYTHACARWMPPFLGMRYRIIWSQFENCDRREDIKHPAVRGCLEYLGIDEPFEVNHAGDLPARTGLGSSSAFTVTLLNALHCLQGRMMVGRDILAREAVAVEHDVLRENVGIQDQIACAYGGLNMIEIDRTGDYEVRRVFSAETPRLDELQSHLMLFYTGLQRFASEIASEQIAKMGEHTSSMKAIQSMAHQGLAILRGQGNIEAFGELLHDAWLLKRGLSSKITTQQIDSIYWKAIGAGALGGKLLGAGGGGFMLLFARPIDQPAVRHALTGLLEIPFRFEHKGAQLIHAS
jgi:D-glycero-alpha-D-manno-heptose-7-phosphate kinase